MGIWDDFVETVSDGADAVGDAIDEGIELGEEGLDEAAKLFMEEILGIDFDSSDGGSPSEGHDYDADYGDTSDELKLADPTDYIFTKVNNASTESDVLQWLWTDDLFGTIDDLVTEPDATHVFDDVAGTVDDVVTQAKPQPSDIGVSEFVGADIAADSLQFVNPHSSSAENPNWTNFSGSDPYAGSLEVSAYLASDSILGYAPNGESTQTTVIGSLPQETNLDFTTTLQDASTSFSVSWLF